MTVTHIKRFFRTYQILITSGSIFLLAFLGLIFGVVPLAMRTSALFEELATLTNDVDTLQQKMAVLQSIDERTLRSNLLVLTSAVPADKSLATLFGTLDGLVATTGISVADVSLTKLGAIATEAAVVRSSQERAIGANFLPLVITATGTYEQMHAFLKTIPDIRRFLRIRSFDMTIQEASVLSHFTMDAFYAPLPTRIGAATDPVSGLDAREDQIIGNVSALRFLGEAPVTGQIPAASPSSIRLDPFSL